MTPSGSAASDPGSLHRPALLRCREIPLLPRLLPGITVLWNQGHARCEPRIRFPSELLLSVRTGLSVSANENLRAGFRGNRRPGGRRRAGLTSGRAEERERRGFVIRCVFRGREPPHAAVKGNGHRRRLDARGQAEGAKGAGAIFPRMIRRNGGSTPISGDIGGDRCRFAGRRTGGLGLRRAGIALGRFRYGNEQEEPDERECYFRKIRSQVHFSNYILQEGVRQRLSF